jgi:hypothetical protein
MRWLAFLERDPPDPLEEGLNKALYWIVWLALAILAAAMLLATLNRP